MRYKLIRGIESDQMRSEKLKTGDFSALGANFPGNSPKFTSDLPGRRLAGKIPGQREANHRRLSDSLKAHRVNAPS